MTVQLVKNGLDESMGGQILTSIPHLFEGGDIKIYVRDTHTQSAFIPDNLTVTAEPFG